MTPVAAPALIFHPSSTVLRYGLITEVIRGLVASSVISTKQIAMSLHSLLWAGPERNTEGRRVHQLAVSLD